MERDKFRYKMQGKVKTVRTEEKQYKKVKFFIVGKKPVYIATLTPYTEDRYRCDIIDKNTKELVYQNNDIEVFDSSSLMRCVSIFTRMKHDEEC